MSRLAEIKTSHTATIAAPNRGSTASTNSPATISITPTAIINCAALTGSFDATAPGKYLPQSVSRFVNLSAPATIGTRP